MTVKDFYVDKHNFLQELEHLFELIVGINTLVEYEGFVRDKVSHEFTLILIEYKLKS